MPDTKQTTKWYKSPTFWTALITVLVSIIGFLGVEVTPETQEMLVTHITSGITAVAGFIVLVRNIWSKRKKE